MRTICIMLLLTIILQGCGRKGPLILSPLPAATPQAAPAQSSVVPPNHPPRNPKARSNHERIFPLPARPVVRRKRPLNDIAQRFGTPCYVYSRAALTDGYRQFAEAFKSREHLICYAVKANSNLAILNLFARLGAGFDIVSGGELQRVLAAGGAANKVVFSGVGKSEAEMRQALEAGDTLLQRRIFVRTGSFE